MNLCTIFEWLAIFYFYFLFCTPVYVVSHSLFRRKVVFELRNRLNLVRAQLRPYERYNGKSTGLIEGLEIARDFMQQTAKTKEPKAEGGVEKEKVDAVGVQGQRAVSDAELTGALGTLNLLLAEEQAKFAGMNLSLILFLRKLENKRIRFFFY